MRTDIKGTFSLNFPLYDVLFDCRFHEAPYNHVLAEEHYTRYLTIFLVGGPDSTPHSFCLSVIQSVRIRT